MTRFFKIEFATQAREGIVTTREQAAEAYDRVIEERLPLEG